MNKPGVKAMIDRLTARGGEVISPERLVEGCLDQMGAISVSPDTQSALVRFASTGGDLRLSASGPDEQARRRVAELLQLAAATHEFQRN